MRAGPSLGEVTYKLLSWAIVIWVVIHKTLSHADVCAYVRVDVCACTRMRTFARAWMCMHMSDAR